MEVRLIDESTLQRELFCQIQQNAIESGSAHYDGYKNWCLSGLEVEKAISDIFSETGFFCPTIDPETLPIVQELRKELEQTERELRNVKYCYDIAKNGEKQLRRQANEVTAEWAECVKKLKRVTAERDAALKQISDTCDCDTCKHTGCIQRGGTGCGQ